MAVWFYPGQEDYITKLNELGAIAELISGPDGWSPELAVVPDGERRVFQVADWVGGETTKPPIGDYVGSTGYVSNIADAIDIRGPQGIQGPSGTDGADGVNGTNGEDGPPNVLTIGTVTGGATASATITGTSPSQVLNLVLPKGNPGTNGTNGLAATIAVGTVTTGAPGTSATVVNSGTSSAAVFNFTIPRGDTGSGGGGSGDVVGPSGATNNGVALFDGTTGKLLKSGSALGTAAFSATSAFATAAQGTKADTAVQPGSLATVATSGAYADLTGKPTLGTASTLNVPATGNAATGEVVKGNDTRLSDSRTPTGTAGGVLSGSYPNPGFAVDMATQAELDAVSSVANSKLSDAPSDGKTYGRKDAAWAAAEPSIATSVAANYWSGDKSWRDFFASVRSATLTGLSTATNAAATATDTVLSAIGKLQAQINNRQQTLVSGTNIKTLNGSSLLGAGNVVISGGVSADTGFDTVGSFCVARVTSVYSEITGGSTVAGSSLRPGSFNGSSVYDNSGASGPTLSGTWRALGQTSNSPAGFFLLFQRIA